MVDMSYGFKYFYVSVGAITLVILVMCIPALLGIQIPDPIGVTSSISTSQPVVNIPKNSSYEMYQNETKRISEKWEVLGHRPSMCPVFINTGVK